MDEVRAISIGLRERTGLLLARRRRLGRDQAPPSRLAATFLLCVLCLFDLAVAGGGEPTPVNEAAQPEFRGQRQTVSGSARLLQAGWPHAVPALHAAKGALTFAKTLAPLPFQFERGAQDRERALDCLANAAWYEAGNDQAGQRAVIQVVLNRLRHPAFPKSVCGVVFEGSQLTTGCQFSFTCDGSRARRTPSRSAWNAARHQAALALSGAVDEDVGSATHYHADYVTPWWSSELQPVTKIEGHIFYVWKGAFGWLPRHHIPTNAEPPIPEFDVTRPADAEAGVESHANLAASHVATMAAGENASSATALQTPSVSRDFLVVNSAGSSGRWALDAMKRCAGRTSCRVIGYDSEAQILQNTSRGIANMDRPLFLFVRDASSGMDLALWDCELIRRPTTSQCLPGDRQQLAHLMRER
ncbi:cell wall hydrolase [Novosphingobium album (ex Hu et al. 2023)]|uniref:Cell wall hydrolase n=1 Tax=Novosphingobium album (ex Hu et al. 2023) TaxID=2930093 RepID=A0ABT0B407_9SPHN|nr:cell wall hydrolase [Novosphingobium album (ex Hu et al. 2023)]MCJ2179780.1 cell wall hydrolase [Novosphingobium album (ex Hu et al. 2023)]